VKTVERNPRGHHNPNLTLTLGEDGGRKEPCGQLRQILLTQLLRRVKTVERNPVDTGKPQPNPPTQVKTQWELPGTHNPEPQPQPLGEDG
jgi:hypothetical protein